MKSIIYLFLLCASIILLSTQCTTTRFIEPLEIGQWAAGADVGGPIIKLGGNTIPVPLSSLHLGYGYKENLTIYGGLHTTSLLFNNLQFDLGARRNVFEGYSIYPSISTSFAVNGVMSFRNFKPRIYPEINVNAYWKYGKWRTYTGAQTWFDFYKGLNTTYGFNGFFVPGIVLGQDIKLGDWRIGVEYKRLAFNVATENSVVNYVTFGGVGAQGIYLSCSKTFGHKKQKTDEKL